MVRLLPYATLFQIDTPPKRMFPFGGGLCLRPRNRVFLCYQRGGGGGGGGGMYVAAG